MAVKQGHFGIRRILIQPTWVELIVLFVAMDAVIFLSLSRRPATVVSIVAHCVLGVWFVWTRRRAARLIREKA